MANRSSKMVDKKIFKKKLKILIFGGSGFLGSHVAEELANRNYKVTVVDQKSIIWSNKNINFVKSDILNFKKISKLIKKNNIVYNFAAIADIGYSYKKPLETLKINIMGNNNILHLCSKYKIKRYIFASTIYVYSEQGGFYRASKEASEILIDEYNRIYNLPYTVLRYGSIYGPRTNLKNGLFKIIYDAIKSKKLIYRGSDRAVRSYIHVQDAAKISADILKKKFKNKNILVTGKQSIKIKSLLKSLGRIMKIYKKPIFLNQTQKGHYDVTPFSKRKIKTISCFPKKPLKLELGLKKLIEIIKRKNR